MKAYEERIFIRYTFAPDGTCYSMKVIGLEPWNHKGIWEVEYKTPKGNRNKITLREEKLGVAISSGNLIHVFLKEEDDNFLTAKNALIEYLKTRINKAEEELDYLNYRLLQVDNNRTGVNKRYGVCKMR